MELKVLRQFNSELREEEENLVWEISSNRTLASAPTKQNITRTAMKAQTHLRESAIAKTFSFSQSQREREKNTNTDRESKMQSRGRERKKAEDTSGVRVWAPTIRLFL